MSRDLGATCFSTYSICATPLWLNTTSSHISLRLCSRHFAAFSALILLVLNGVTWSILRISRKFTFLLVPIYIYDEMVCSNAADASTGAVVISGSRVPSVCGKRERPVHGSVSGAADKRHVAVIYCMMHDHRSQHKWASASVRYFRKRCG